MLDFGSFHYGTEAILKEHQWQLHSQSPHQRTGCGVEDLQTKELQITVNKLEKSFNNFDQLKYDFEEKVNNNEILQ